MDEAFKTGMRFDFNIIHNFEKIKLKLRQKENKNQKKNSMNLPDIKQNYISQFTLNKNFNSVEIGELKNELSSAYFKENNSVVNENINNNNLRRTINSQDFHNELSTDNNVINNYNESKNVSVIGENEETINHTKSKRDFLKRSTLIQNTKDSNELKGLSEKDIISKTNIPYHRMKTENMLFKSFAKKKSSNQLLDQLTHGSEAEEGNKSNYDRFFKRNQKLQTPAENYDEENKIPEIDQKEDEEPENYFEFLRKPKRKIQIAIFTQKNIKEEEIQDLEPLMKKLEINDKNDEPKNAEIDSIEKKIKSIDKDKKFKHSPIKHPLVFPEFNKYGLYSGSKKQELKVNYAKNVLKKNSNFHKNRSLVMNNSNQEDIKNKSASDSPHKNGFLDKSDKLPKIKGKLQAIYKEDTELLRTIRNLKHINKLTLEEYQLKLIDCAKKILDDENLKNLVDRFKDISELSQTKDKVKWHKSINRWEIMVKVISRYIPEFLVEKLKKQK